MFTVLLSQGDESYLDAIIDGTASCTVATDGICFAEGCGDGIV